MAELPDISSPKDLRWGRDPFLDAWLLHFMTENNLEHLLNPLHNASPEQLRFMVALEEDQVFAPCSDELFSQLFQPETPGELLKAYAVSWRVVARLIRNHVEDSYSRRRIYQFCRHRFRQALAARISIPSRVTKRLATIVMTQTGLEDPFREVKQAYNRRAKKLLDSPLLDGLINQCPEERLVCLRLQDLRWELDMLELRRLFALSSTLDIWGENDDMPSAEHLRSILAMPCSEFDRIHQVFGPQQNEPKTILYLPNSSGGVMFDLMIIRSLLRQGHYVILALKAGFYFQTPTIWDVECDPVLAEALRGAHVLLKGDMTKNELLKTLREHRFLVISDGTRERLNLYRVSVTFARAWKEADVVLAKGDPHFRRLISNSHEFTRDVLCFYADEQGGFHLAYKPKSANVRKFSESDLRDLADGIISDMRIAKSTGKRVMFYSAIVGSIPGQTKAAIRILNTFVAHLRSRLQDVMVINPAEHFVPGMDGDDLMFMWERVQRSGLIDVWRFQSVADIDKSFELLGEKVPPVWIGKDATFSTGCTKEMHIALDVQRSQPELQIIGPSAEKFFRRREYGVGKYFDASIEYQ
ncbi:MAG: DUF89 family protein [Desulfovibrio sp.]|nr:MAG: DUF89 family protein [Desulfovibrio sp.]